MRHGIKQATSTTTRSRYRAALVRIHVPSSGESPDIIMPEQEGIETIVKIRSERPDVKIIAISGGARTHNLDYLGMAEAFGADDVISKPFEAEELLSRLARFDLGAPASEEL
jgi:response regulator RpfG family c-di-GMP phosphodiesterase